MPSASEAPAPLDLGVAITTRNNITTIERAIRSVQTFNGRPLAARIVVIDSGSTDGTIELCRSLNCEVIHRDWQGPTLQKQFAIDQCRNHRWVLLLDSDESLEPDLQQSLLNTVLADDPAYDGWAINRKIHFLGDWLHYTFQPEWRLRLVRGGKAVCKGLGPEGRGGHDRLEVPGRVGRLAGFCRHDSWLDLHDMCLRNVALARRAAEYANSGGSPLHILISPPAAMFKQLILRRGFLDGWRGWVAAGSVASGTMLKHLFIAARRQQRAAECHEARF